MKKLSLTKWFFIGASLGTVAAFGCIGTGYAQPLIPSSEPQVAAEPTPEPQEAPQTMMAPRGGTMKMWLARRTTDIPAGGSYEPAGMTPQGLGYGQLSSGTTAPVLATTSLTKKLAPYPVVDGDWGMVVGENEDVLGIRAPASSTLATTNQTRGGGVLPGSRMVAYYKASGRVLLDPLMVVSATPVMQTRSGIVCNLAGNGITQACVKVGNETIPLPIPEGYTSFAIGASPGGMYIAGYVLTTEKGVLVSYGAIWTRQGNTWTYGFTKIGDSLSKDVAAVSVNDRGQAALRASRADGVHVIAFDMATTSSTGVVTPAVRVDRGIGNPTAIDSSGDIVGIGAKNKIAATSTASITPKGGPSLSDTARIWMRGGQSYDLLDGSVTEFPFDATLGTTVERGEAHGIDNHTDVFVKVSYVGVPTSAVFILERMN